MVRTVFPPLPKVWAPIFVMLDGISTNSRLSQCLIEAMHSSFMPWGRTIFFNDLQPSNVREAKLSRPTGRTASFRLSQPSNASAPMPFVRFGNLTLTNDLQPLYLQLIVHQLVLVEMVEKY